ncbi:hypothetical protein [Phenylobacterium sp.]|uniref:hypothetical protein n=1 Tax=Phenylobacterium sp. TaxID=1871053 RepID=UPI0011F4BC8B|nr:hypothetical protein [Phenylobacterium sp.]THD54140.1 MAG: hypothetical protein E8A12_17700 [Phenylobacterium sp.]
MSYGAEDRGGTVLATLKTHARDSWVRWVLEVSIFASVLVFWPRLVGHAVQAAILAEVFFVFLAILWQWRRPVDARADRDGAAD